jgi:signal transduction histidine kinase
VASCLVTLGLSFHLLSDEPLVRGEAWVNAPIAIGFATVAAVIWASRPNPRGLVILGALFTVVGLGSALVLPTYGWARSELPGSTFAAWVSNWVWTLGAPPLLGLSLLLYPDGRLPGRHWWPGAALGLTGIALLACSGALAPGSLENHPSVRNPVGIGAAETWDRVALIGFPMLMAAAVIGLAGLITRFVRSPSASDVRGQLTGFAIAGALVVLAASVPADAATQAALALLAGTALPATVGFAVLRHRLLDQHLAVVGLHRQVDELTRARREIVSEREEERDRLRRELHDGLGPSLAAIGLGLRTLEHDPGRVDSIHALADEVQRAVAEVRRLCEGLRPPALDELGLSRALGESLSRLDRFGPQVTVRIGSLRPLPPAVEVAAYRITMEAATNAVRHSGARRVSVQLDQEGDDLRLVVADDGSGLRTPVTQGMGLSTMRTRAEELNGSLEVHSNEKGTTVSALLPAGRGA